MIFPPIAYAVALSNSTKAGKEDEYVVVQKHNP